MSKCPECGSSDIVPDLNVLTEETTSGHRPLYIKLVEPEPAKLPFIWVAQEVKSEFSAAVCGQCGFTQFHSKNYAEVLDAHKKGYSSNA